MSEPHVTLDPTDLPPNARRLVGPLEDQLSSALQHATDYVGEHYHGQTVDEVSVELLAETRRALHPDIAEAFEPGEGELRRVAEEIVNRAGRSGTGAQ
jgi:hypothetical protein